MSSLPKPPSQGFIIAIDGPVASGKGTIAPMLAKRLGGFFLATGMMYRCAALFCIQNSVSPKDKEAILPLLPNLHIDMRDDGVYLNGTNVSEQVMVEEMGMKASDVSIFPEVRAVVRKSQQDVGVREREKGRIVVAEGRDAATKIFPDAAVKLFLTAKSEIRAKRRLLQMQQRHGDHITFEQVLADTLTRDKQDMERAVDPLVSEPEKYGYVVIDSSTLSEEQTVASIITVLQKKGLLYD